MRPVVVGREKNDRTAGTREGTEHPIPLIEASLVFRLTQSIHYGPTRGHSTLVSTTAMTSKRHLRAPDRMDVAKDGRDKKKQCKISDDKVKGRRSLTSRSTATTSTPARTRKKSRKGPRERLNDSDSSECGDLDEVPALSTPAPVQKKAVVQSPAPVVSSVPVSGKEAEDDSESEPQNDSNLAVVLAQTINDFRKERSKKKQVAESLRKATLQIKILEDRLAKVEAGTVNGKTVLQGANVLSALTENSLSGKPGRVTMEKIAAEWFLSAGAETLCKDDDNLRPFRSPFKFVHWGPLANGEEQYLFTLRQKFLRAMMKEESAAVLASFDNAYDTKEPGMREGVTLKDTYKNKRRAHKADTIGKKVEAQRLALSKRSPPVAIKDGSEWRQDLERAKRAGEGSCLLFTAIGAADFFDEIFRKAPEYDGRDPSPHRRFVTITQLAILDTSFQHKAQLAEKREAHRASQLVKFTEMRAKAVTEEETMKTEKLIEKEARKPFRDFGSMSKGTDGKIASMAASIALSLSPVLQGKTEACSCCCLLDMSGAPAPLPITVAPGATALVEEATGNAERDRDYDTDDSGSNDDSHPGRGSESEESGSDRDD